MTPFFAAVRYLMVWSRRTFSPRACTIRCLSIVGNDLRQYEAKFTDGLLVGLRMEDDALYDERGLKRIQEDSK